MIYRGGSRSDGDSELLLRSACEENDQFHTPPCRRAYDSVAQRTQAAQHIKSVYVVQFVEKKPGALEAKRGGDGIARLLPVAHQPIHTNPTEQWRQQLIS